MQFTVGDALFDIVVLLLAAKVAAEISQRLGIPAVVGEILAGIIIGPSLFHLVSGSEVLDVLGELGVILLLVEVGMHVNLAELAKVGRAALFVASIGVVAPFVGGYAAGMWLGLPGDAALFAGAALTATSVGITARVFGDLGALSSPEARTVLGAAVADDVIGLLILTLITSSIGGGSVSPGQATVVLATALLVLGGSGLVGAWLAPRAFEQLQRWARSPGTLVAMSLAFILAFGIVADLAGLAPVIGAFVAGIALGRSTVSDRIHRELAPVGHLLVPVFFLQIGVQTRVGELAHAGSIWLAVVLLGTAIAGKLVSGIGAFASRGDKLTIGVGMLPRGEVGLIFATIGLDLGAIDQEVYGALLVVVLVTTLMSPFLLRWRVRVLGATRADAATRAIGVRPAAHAARGLDVQDGIVDLNGDPPAALGLHLGLEAALTVASGKRPGARLMEWLDSLPGSALRWDARASHLFCQLLREGNERSWRLLEVSRLLERTLPEMARAVRMRGADPLELDPIVAFKWSLLDRLHDVIDEDPRAARVAKDLDRTESLYVAALVLSIAGEGPDALKLGRRLANRLTLGARIEQDIAAVVREASLLCSAMKRANFLDEEPVLGVARRLGSDRVARCAYLISLSLDTPSDADRQRLDALFTLVSSVLSHEAANLREKTNLVERKRSEAAMLTGDDEAARARSLTAPRSHVRAVTPADLARHAAMLTQRIDRGEAQVAIHATGDRSWVVEIAAHDKAGLLAHTTAVLVSAGIEVTSAVVGTWSDGLALQSFTVAGTEAPVTSKLAQVLRHEFRRSLEAEPTPDADVTFDNESSPWHTGCTVRARDRPGLLRSLTAAIAIAGGDIRSARIATTDDVAVDYFELTDRQGLKPSNGTLIEIRGAIIRGARAGSGPSERALAATFRRWAFETQK